MIKSKNKNPGKNTLFHLDRYTFFIDTNNLVNIPMISSILDKFDDKFITRLNDVIKGIKFYIGGNHWHFNEKGYLRYPTYEFNFNDNTLLIFLSKIFELGVKRWRKLFYGSLKRFVWESFCHEIIMNLIHILKLNLKLTNEAKEYYLNREDKYTKDFVAALFDSKENFPLRVNFISINNILWKEPLPKSLGFFDVLYNRRITELKKRINVPLTSNVSKIRFFNELRKIKMKYKYEYNLSELVNYCIRSAHFETFYLNQGSVYEKIRKEFYYKAKRQILKFFNRYEISDELKEYKDSANRIHYFLTHKTFERVKSACLQTCIANIKNNHLEEYQHFRNFYSKCPICKEENVNHFNCEKFYFSNFYKHHKTILMEKMKETNSSGELNDNTSYFGIACEDCYKIIRNIQGEFSELETIQKFISIYKNCPNCGSKNHDNYLLSFYHDKSKNELKKFMIENMKKKKKIRDIKVHLGIPCCSCFENIFREKPASYDFTSFY